MSFDDEEIRQKAALHVEDVAILLSVGALFVLTVFFREEVWAQILLVGVFLLMVVVFILRFRRVHRAFQDQEDAY